MTTVYKYVLVPDDVIRVSMPSGARLLHFGEQDGQYCVWAEVDPSAPQVVRMLRMAGTGHPIYESMSGVPHVGTCISMGGRLVFHLFDLGEKP